MKDIIERLNGPGIADYELDPGVCEAAISEIRKLRARVEANERDAERYRWIRNPTSGAEKAVFYRVDKEGFGRRLKCSTMLDNDVDAAMREQK